MIAQTFHQENGCKMTLILCSSFFLYNETFKSPQKATLFWLRINFMGIRELNLDPYWIHITTRKSESEVTQSCPTLCNPTDCSLPGSSIHGILQARILEWVAVSFSRGSSRPRNRTHVSLIAGRRFNLWATREAESIH